MRADGSQVCKIHRLLQGHDIVEARDLRTDPAFAWRVWCAYIAWVTEVEEPSPRDEALEKVWHDMVDCCVPPEDALYAAMEARGRDEK